MFIKVIINEDGEICREDDGTIIGELASLIGYHFFTTEGEVTELKYGYFDKWDSFNELCQLQNCSHKCLSHEKPNCRYVRKGNETEGFYYLYKE